MSGSGVPLRELALVILVAAAFTYLTTGVVRSFLVRTGRVAEIRLRDAHTQPTPRMGGVAMVYWLRGGNIPRSPASSLDSRLYARHSGNECGAMGGLGAGARWRGR